MNETSKRRFADWANGFCVGMLLCLLMCGAAVCVVDSRRRAAEAENDEAWARTCEGAWDRGWEAGRRVERTYILAGGME